MNISSIKDVLDMLQNTNTVEIVNFGEPLTKIAKTLFAIVLQEISKLSANAIEAFGRESREYLELKDLESKAFLVARKFIPEPTEIDKLYNMSISFSMINMYFTLQQFDPKHNYAWDRSGSINPIQDQIDYDISINYQPDQSKDFLYQKIKDLIDPQTKFYAKGDMSNSERYSPINLIFTDGFYHYSTDRHNLTTWPSHVFPSDENDKKFQPKLRIKGRSNTSSKRRNMYWNGNKFGGPR